MPNFAGASTLKKVLWFQSKNVYFLASNNVYQYGPTPEKYKNPDRRYSLCSTTKLSPDAALE